MAPGKMERVDDFYCTIYNQCKFQLLFVTNPAADANFIDNVTPTETVTIIVRRACL